MNILITSVGRRSYLVKYFKEELSGRGFVHVSNCISDTPAFLYADYNVVTPLIYDKEYIPFLLRYCKVNRISALISLFDVDLSILAENKEAFRKIGTNLLLSDVKVINICNDKWETYCFLKKIGIDTPNTYLGIEEGIGAVEEARILFPVIVKPRWGMGSIGVMEACNMQELEIFYSKVNEKIHNSYLKYEADRYRQEGVIIQERIEGDEFGLDIINDLEGGYCNTIVKRKLAMRAGETDYAEVIEDKRACNIGESIAIQLKHIANLDVDVMRDREGGYHVLEMNARFGGGYPFSHAAGVNLPRAIIKWLGGDTVEQEILIPEIGIKAYKDLNIVKV